MRDLAVLSDNQAEAGVIATLLYHPDFILHSDYLKPGYFYNVENGCLYWALQELTKAGVDNVDALNLANMINSNAAVRKTIQNHNISDLNEFISLASYAARGTLEEYKLLTNRVVELAFRRDLYKVSGQIEGECFDENIKLQDLNVRVNTEISKLTERYLTSQEIVTFGEKIDTLWNEVERRRTSNGYYGIPTILPSMNEFVTYEPGELVVLQARMKKGKSAFFLNTAISMMKNNIPVCYLDTEMSSRATLERMVSSLTGIEVNRVKSGKYSSEENEMVKKALAWIKSKPFYHFYLPSPQKDEIYSILKILKYKVNLQFCIYDYIKCDTGDSGTNSNILGDLTSFLKNNCAGELNIAMVAGVQLSRENLVAGSDKILRYCSTGIMWEEKTAEDIQKDGEEAGNFRAWVNINRNGPSHEEGEEWVDVIFDKSRMRIKEAAPHRVPNPFDNS